MKKIFVLFVLLNMSVFQTKAVPLLNELDASLSSRQIEELRLQRKALIVEAFNQMPAKMIEPLTLSDVELGLIDGRVNVNKKAKFSYYVQIQEVNNRISSLLLIPMATSRFTPTYYQTDAWWDAHKNEIEQARKEGRPVPKQDMNEVEAWLQEMKLTTNPDVLILEVGLNQDQSLQLKKVIREPLQKYLLDFYLKNYVKDGFITLYRGAEKPGEFNSWNRQETPRGVRYWTPTVNYAWRYARKNTDFFTLLLKNETPLFKYKIPVQDFKNMVEKKWPQLTLGTELTKNAHQIFDHYQYFGDHLFSSLPFTGEGSMGVELELRSNRSGADQMTKYYQGPVTIEDLVFDRISVLKRTMSRLEKQDKSKFESEWKKHFQKRIENALFELEIIKMIHENKPEFVIENRLKSDVSFRSETTHIDGFNFKAWVREQARNKSLSCVGLF